MGEPNELGHLPIGDVLPGMTMMPLEEGFVAETVFALIKMRGDDGATVWGWRSPEITNHEEVLGALIVQVELLKQQLLDSWE
jgi:hypothetical protein